MATQRPWDGLVQGAVVTVAAIGKRVDTASTNHRSVRLFTAPSAVSCQQEFTAISNQRRAVGELLDADWRAGAAGK